uniref:EGF-like domain-containing protein n=1 Tax=Parastrongyloides trichosuri TaxID=131310 RepID=A0A0N4ZQG0_PARTI
MEYTHETVLRPLNDEAYHGYSPDVYYNKYCSNNKCGENGECFPITIKPKGVVVKENYFCKCKSCYSGEFCHTNICPDDDDFFSTTRNILILVTLIVSTFYGYCIYRFVIFYFTYIHGHTQVMRATEKYFVDSISQLKRGNKENPTVLVLRRAVAHTSLKRSQNKVMRATEKYFVDSISQLKRGNKENPTVLVLRRAVAHTSLKRSQNKGINIKKKKNSNSKNKSREIPIKQQSLNGKRIKETSTIGSETIPINQISTSTNDNVTSSTINDSSMGYNIPIQSNRPVQKVLTPYPAKYRMVNIFGENNLKKLGVMGNNKTEETKGKK